MAKSIEYPISPSVLNTLSRFPRIAEAVRLPKAGRSRKDIFRLLDNSHFRHIEALVEFINQNIEASGPIGKRVIDQVDQFELHQALSELFLFVYLRKILGRNVAPVHAPRAVSHPDISIQLDSSSILVECFCPIDLMGFQLVKRYTTTILKYLDVNRGFRLVVEIQLNSGATDPFYPYLIGAPQTVRRWLSELVDKAASWLRSDETSSPLFVDGPNRDWRLVVRAFELHKDRDYRLIEMSPPTQSTDTRLFFECGSAESTIQSEWGKKLRRKLKQRQCGDPAPELYRLLVVDFSMADTGWPDFICWPPIASRMAQVVHHIVDELDEPTPYDIVVPAQLGPFVCGFGPPIWLGSADRASAGCLLEAAGLAVPVKANEPGVTDWGQILESDG